MLLRGLKTTRRYAARQQSMCSGFSCVRKDRLQPLVTGSNRPRVCKNVDTVWKSALLHKICQRLDSRQT